MSNKTPTPYDSGARLEPHRWHGPLADVDPEDFGNVDFDNENGDTELTIHVSRNEDGSLTVHIIPQNDLTTISVETHEEE